MSVNKGDTEIKKHKNGFFFSRHEDGTPKTQKRRKKNDKGRTTKKIKCITAYYAYCVCVCVNVDTILFGGFPFSRVSYF